MADCHLHLQSKRLTVGLDGGQDGILARARQSGVSAMFCNATCFRDWSAVIQLAGTNSDIIPFLGTHPWYMSDKPADWLDQLERLLTGMPAGVGEIGLDGLRKGFDAVAQERAFVSQLDIADKLGRCINVHCLKAWGRLADILQHRGAPRNPMLLHAFGGSAEMVEILAGMNAYFSFAGNVLNERAKRMRTSLLAVPLDRLLIETDSPDLSPPPRYRSVESSRPPGDEINEPANIPGIYRGIAELRGLPVEELAAQVWQNARRFLGNIAPKWMADS